MVNGRVYTGKSDGTFRVRNFDGEHFGAATGPQRLVQLR